MCVFSVINKWMNEFVLYSPRSRETDGIFMLSKWRLSVWTADRRLHTRHFPIKNPALAALHVTMLLSWGLLCHMQCGWKYVDSVSAMLLMSTLSSKSNLCCTCVLIIVWCLPTVEKYLYIKLLQANWNQNDSRISLTLLPVLLFYNIYLNIHVDDQETLPASEVLQQVLLSGFLWLRCRLSVGGTTFLPDLVWIQAALPVLFTSMLSVSST